MDFLNEREASWLERSLRKIYESNPSAVCIAAVVEGGVMAAYSNCNAGDKTNMASAIHIDAVMDTIRANGHIIREALEDEEED